MTKTNVDLAAVRRRLGLPANASAQQINAALAKPPAAPKPAPSTTARQSPAFPAEHERAIQQAVREGRISSAPSAVARWRGRFSQNATQAFADLTARRTGDAGQVPTTAAERDRMVAAAVAEGRIVDTPERRAHWTVMLRQEPEETAFLLSGSPEDGAMVAGLTHLREREPESVLAHRAVSMVGMAGVAQARPMRSSSAATASRASSTSTATVSRDATGALVFGGVYPVALASSGEPCVFTANGWMTSAAFKASGLPLSELDSGLQIHNNLLSGMSPLRSAFQAGPQ